MYQSKMRMQQENVDKGQLQITVLNSEDNRPVENALVRISYSGDPESTVEELRTDDSGKTPVLDMKTPPLDYSMAPVEQQPYAEYTIQVEAEGFANGETSGTEVLPDVLAQQAVRIEPRRESGVGYSRIVIGPHTLFGEYPPKIEEAEIKIR